MKQKIKNKNGKYKMKYVLELKDILLILMTVGAVVLIAYFCEV